MSPHLRDLLVNLSSVFAFAVGVLQGGQLQQTHPKAVHVHLQQKQPANLVRPFLPSQPATPSHSPWPILPALLHQACTPDLHYAQTRTSPHPQAALHPLEPLATNSQPTLSFSSPHLKLPLPDPTPNSPSRCTFPHTAPAAHTKARSSSSVSTHTHTHTPPPPRHTQAALDSQLPTTTHRCHELGRADHTLRCYSTTPKGGQPQVTDLDDTTGPIAAGSSEGQGAGRSRFLPTHPRTSTGPAPLSNSRTHMKMLSHFRSRWMMGGLCPCKYTSPCSICHAQRFSTCSSTFLCFLRYLEQSREGGGRAQPQRHPPHQHHQVDAEFPGTAHWHEAAGSSHSEGCVTCVRAENMSACAGEGLTAVGCQT